MIEKIPTEHEEQVKYFQYLKIMEHKYPLLAIAHASPNGSLRNKIVAKKIKAEGGKTGIPDIFIPIANDQYSGLFIELKRVKRSVLSEDQKFIINCLNDNGFLAIVCYGAQDAYNTTMFYLRNMKMTQKTKYDINIEKLNKNSVNLYKNVYYNS
jgi:hypothetical protein